MPKPVFCLSLPETVGPRAVTILRQMDDGQWYSAKDIAETIGVSKQAVLESLVRMAKKDIPYVSRDERASSDPHTYSLVSVFQITKEGIKHRETLYKTDPKRHPFGYVKGRNPKEVEE